MAAVKDIAREVIAALPDGASMDDIIQALYVREKYERGLRQAQDGQGILSFLRERSAESGDRPLSDVRKERD